MSQRNAPKVLRRYTGNVIHNVSGSSNNSNREASMISTLDPVGDLTLRNVYPSKGRSQSLDNSNHKVAHPSSTNICRTTGTLLQQQPRQCRSKAIHRSMSMDDQFIVTSDRKATDSPRRPVRQPSSVVWPQHSGDRTTIDTYGEKASYHRSESTPSAASFEWESERYGSPTHPMRRPSFDENGETQKALRVTTPRKIFERRHSIDDSPGKRLTMAMSPTKRITHRTTSSEMVDHHKDMQNRPPQLQGTTTRSAHNINNHNSNTPTALFPPPSLNLSPLRRAKVENVLKQLIQNSAQLGAAGMICGSRGVITGNAGANERIRISENYQADSSKEMNGTMINNTKPNRGDREYYRSNSQSPRRRTMNLTRSHSLEHLDLTEQACEPQNGSPKQRLPRRRSSCMNERSGNDTAVHSKLPPQSPRRTSCAGLSPPRCRVKNVGPVHVAEDVLPTDHPHDMAPYRTRRSSSRDRNKSIPTIQQRRSNIDTCSNIPTEVEGTAQTINDSLRYLFEQSNRLLMNVNNQNKEETKNPESIGLEEEESMVLLSFDSSMKLIDSSTKLEMHQHPASSPASPHTGYLKNYLFDKVSNAHASGYCTTDASALCHNISTVATSSTSELTASTTTTNLIDDDSTLVSLFGHDSIKLMRNNTTTTNATDDDSTVVPLFGNDSMRLMQKRSSV